MPTYGQDNLNVRRRLTLQPRNDPDHRHFGAVGWKFRIGCETSVWIRLRENQATTGSGRHILGPGGAASLNEMSLGHQQFANVNLFVAPHFGQSIQCHSLISTVVTALEISWSITMYPIVFFFLATLKIWPCRSP